MSRSGVEWHWKLRRESIDRNRDRIHHCEKSWKCNLVLRNRTVADIIPCFATLAFKNNNHVLETGSQAEWLLAAAKYVSSICRQTFEITLADFHSRTFGVSHHVCCYPWTAHDSRCCLEDGSGHRHRTTRVRPGQAVAGLCFYLIGKAQDF